jgi:hypothetical protein
VLVDHSRLWRRSRKAIALSRLRLQPQGIDLEEAQRRAEADFELPTPSEAHDFRIYVPLTMSLFCKGRNITTVLDIFREEDLAGSSLLADDRDLPSILIDDRERKTIYVPSQDTPSAARRFVALQYAYLALHLPSGARNCVVTPKSVPRDCSNEAGMYARALLMPAPLVVQLLAIHRDTNQLGEQCLAEAFGVPQKMVGKRLQDLRELGQLSGPSRSRSSRHSLPQFEP